MDDDFNADELDALDALATQAFYSQAPPQTTNHKVVSAPVVPLREHDANKIARVPLQRGGAVAVYEETTVPTVNRNTEDLEALRRQVVDYESLISQLRGDRNALLQSQGEVSLLRSRIRQLESELAQQRNERLVSLDAEKAKTSSTISDLETRVSRLTSQLEFKQHELYEAERVRRDTGSVAAPVPPFDRKLPASASSRPCRSRRTTTTRRQGTARRAVVYDAKALFIEKGNIYDLLRLTSPDKTDYLMPPILHTLKLSLHDGSETAASLALLCDSLTTFWRGCSPKLSEEAEDVVLAVTSHALNIIQAADPCEEQLELSVAALVQVSLARATPQQAIRFARVAQQLTRSLATSTSRVRLSAGAAVANLVQPLRVCDGSSSARCPLSKLANVLFFWMEHKWNDSPTLLRETTTLLTFTFVRGDSSLLRERFLTYCTCSWDMFSLLLLTSSCAAELLANDVESILVLNMMNMLLHILHIIYRLRGGSWSWVQTDAKWTMLFSNLAIRLRVLSSARLDLEGNRTLLSVLRHSALLPVELNSTTPAKPSRV